MKQVIDTRTLSEKVLGVPPSEEVLYHEHFQKAIWSLEDFCALMGGLSPQKHKEILEKKFKYHATPSDLQCMVDAQKILNKFIKHFGKIFLSDKIHIANGQCYMTPWKFVKWLARMTVTEKEYLSWIKQHPLGGKDEKSYDFNGWLNSMPTHLISSFQHEVRKIFNFLSI